jgi:hypothetical protein
MSNKLVPYGYIYKTSLPDGRYYYGKHKHQTWDDNYLGSGTLLKRYIRVHGTQNLQCELQEWAYSLQQLNELEHQYIDHLLDDPLCMNLRVGGDGGCGSIDVRKRISETLKKTYKTKGHPFTGKTLEEIYGVEKATKLREKWSKQRTGVKRQLSNDTIERMSKRMSGINNPMYGKSSRENKTEEEKKAISEKISKSNIGKKHPEKTKRKMSESAKGKSKSETHKMNIAKAASIASKGRIWWTNGTINKFQREQPEGFTLGKTVKPYGPKNGSEYSKSWKKAFRKKQRMLST